MRARPAIRLASLAAALAAPALLASPAPAAPKGALELQPLGARASAHLRAHARRAPAPPRGGASARAAGARGVGAVIAALARRGAISRGDALRYNSAYVAAVHSLRALSGTRAEELGAVIANVRAMAAHGTLLASRAPAVFLTLERNRQWWTTRFIPGSGERVGFPGSLLVWQYYPGQGIEIQWLATFGRANGYYLSGHENADLRQLLGEALPLAGSRAGGIAWEYLFQFDGGQPPWTSALSQGTAIQALARASVRLKEPAFLSAATRALGVFEVAPPEGVRVTTHAGATYAEYTYAPGDRILNGFIQSLVGLYEYASIAKDPLGLQLFQTGDAEARAEVPHYDTGAWSRYDQYEESNLNYHELLAEFLQHLCQRTRRGEPFTPAPATPAPPPAATSTPAPAPATTSTPIAGDEVYCTTAQRFDEYLKTPPVVALLSHRLPAGARAGVQVSLSKISTVGLTVRQGGRVVWSNSATVEGGRPRILWVTPAHRGSYQVTLTATDLAGNFSTASGTVSLAGH